MMDESEDMKRASPVNGPTKNEDKRHWENSAGDADLLWEEILDADSRADHPANAGKGNIGIGPGGYAVHITRLAPQPTNLGSIDGSYFAPTPGGPSGGQMLRQYVIDNLHKVPGGAGAKYSLRFYVKGKGGTLTGGYLNLPSQQELMAMSPNPYMQAPMASFARPAMPMAPMMGGWPYPQPQPLPPQPPPPAPTPAATLGSPASAVPAGVDPALAQLLASQQAQIAFLSGQLQQLLGQAPQQLAAPLPAPAPAPVAPPIAAMPPVMQPHYDEFAVLKKFMDLGLVVPVSAAAPPAAPAVAVAAAPVAGPAQTVSQLGEALKVFKELATLGEGFRNTGKEIASSYTTEDEEGEQAAPKGGAGGDNDMPWQRVKIGEDFVWALNKETGGPSLHGIAAEMMANPQVRDKAFEVIGKLADVAKEFMGRAKITSPMLPSGLPGGLGGTANGAAPAPSSAPAPSGPSAADPPNGKGWDV